MIRSLPLMLPILVLCFGSTVPTVLAESSSSDTGQFVMFSDIHFDPFEIPEIAQELTTAPPEDWKALFAMHAAKTLPSYGSDSNYALMKTSLSAVAEQSADADFLIYAGDFLVHRFNKRGAEYFKAEPESAQVREFAIETTLFVANQIRSTLPGKPVIAAIGNNDASCGDYEIEPNGAYLAAIAETVRSLAGRDLVHDDFDETFKTGAYYGTRHPSVTGAHILVLNNLFWSTKYQNRCGDTPAQMGDKMIDWLEENLKRARSQGEKIWLVYHIPAGIDAFSTLNSKAASCSAKVTPFWHSGYTEAFLQLQQAYSNVIVNSFSAHIHHDSFRLFGPEVGQANHVEKISPAISPIYGNNPGFHLFDFNRESASVTDYRTFYLSNMGEVSADVTANWMLEYQFTKAYEKERFDPKSMLEIWQSFSDDEGRNETLFRTFNPVRHGELDTDTMPAYRCAITNITVDSFSECWCDQ